MNNAIPLPVDDNETTPVPRQTMAEMVYGDCCPFHSTGGAPGLSCGGDDGVPECQVCADRGTVHLPEDDSSPFGDD